MKYSTACIFLIIFSLACTPGRKADTGTESAANLKIVSDIAARRARFVPMHLGADSSGLSEGDQEALKFLLEAADAIDAIYKKQVWRNNAEFENRISALQGEEYAPLRDYYRIMYGPWDRLKHMEPFVGETEHPAGGGFYPEDLTIEEFDQRLEDHPEDTEVFRSLHSIILRSENGLEAVAYSKAYSEELTRASAALRSAADLTDNSSLRTFLHSRAAAFETDDYYQSDMDWMDLDSAIEIVIGPYETYEDGLFGYKAAFEAFICLANPEDSKKLDLFKSELPFLESNLPIPDKYKNFNRGSESPIRVVDEIYTAGEARAGVQTLAFNLPNDERVREAKGSKKVLLKNIMHAKYDAILSPIAGHALGSAAAEKLDFESYYLFILFHEMSHGLGPGKITIDGRATEVRLELKELYSAIEEAKADALGVYDLYALAEKGLVDQKIIKGLPWTYTAGLFRTARFGTSEAHGLGVVIQANFLLEAGALELTEEGLFRPVPEKFRKAFEGLAHELLMPQALGSYEMAQKLVEKYGAIRPEMKAILDSLGDVPVDIDPIYTRIGD